MGDDGVKRLTAKRKFEVYLEANKEPEKLGEVLRKYGLHLNDFKRIENAIETAAVEALKGRNGKKDKATLISESEYAELVQELAEKNMALAEITVEYTLLKKSERLATTERLKASTSTGNGGRR